MPFYKTIKFWWLTIYVYTFNDGYTIKSCFFYVVLYHHGRAAVQFNHGCTDTAAAAATITAVLLWVYNKWSQFCIFTKFLCNSRFITYVFSFSSYVIVAANIFKFLRFIYYIRNFTLRRFWGKVNYFKQAEQSLLSVNSIFKCFSYFEYKASSLQIFRLFSIHLNNWSIYHYYSFFMLLVFYAEEIESTRDLTMFLTKWTWLAFATIAKLSIINAYILCSISNAFFC